MDFSRQRDRLMKQTRIQKVKPKQKPTRPTIIAHWRISWKG